MKALHNLTLYGKTLQSHFQNVDDVLECLQPFHQLEYLDSVQPFFQELKTELSVRCS